MGISDWSWWRFLWGAVGALAPEILRLYKIITGDSKNPLPKFGWAYFSISVLFVGVAGLFAVAWHEDNAFKCIWLGVSLPSTISILARKPPEQI